MKQFKKSISKNIVFATMTVLMFNSCATIVTGTHPEVSINGDAKEPVTIVTSYKTYENQTLPALVQVKRKHINGQKITVSSPNYKYRDIMLTKSVNGWAFGNIAIGGLIGWGVDLLTNSVSKPSEDEYKVEFTPKE